MSDINKNTKPEKNDENYPNYDRDTFVESLRREGRSYSNCKEIADEWERVMEND